MRRDREGGGNVLVAKCGLRSWSHETDFGRALRCAKTCHGTFRYNRNQQTRFRAIKWFISELMLKLKWFLLLLSVCCFGFFVFCFCFFVFSCVCYCFGLCSTTVQNQHQSCRPEAACSKLNPFVGQSNAKQRDPQHRQGIFLPTQRIFTIPPAPRIPSAFPLHPSQDFGKWSCSPVITCYLRPALLQRCHPIC